MMGGALVDRGRVLSAQALPKRVEGTTQTTPVASAWFKCRLTMPKGTETTTEGERRRAQRSPQLLVRKRDKAGKAVAITAKDRIEVTSRQLDGGKAEFEVIGDPEPLRKRSNRAPFAWNLTLERVEERRMQRAVS